MRLKSLFAFVPFAVCALAIPANAQKLTLQSVNEAELGKGSSSKNAALIVKVQVLLDRARFSPGAIDGAFGENMRQAVAAYKKAKGLKGGDAIDSALLTSLSEGGAEDVLTTYAISKDDVKGPFVESIPEPLEEQAELDQLAYSGPKEALAEKFHMDPDLLDTLNPGAAFDKEGTEIVVAKVREGALKRVDKIEVDKAEREVRALSETGDLLAVYPATVGSRERPAPDGAFEVEVVARNPNYTYNPEFDWKGVKADKPFVINPGPNNPVGGTWIGINKDGYGLHGTPEPDKVGKASSHGCVRLTNWDAQDLAAAVRKGTDVVFVN